MAIKIGYIGAGNIGRAHMQASQEIGLEMLGVYDANSAAAETAAKEFKIAKTYTDLSQFLADKDIQAVVIGTPNKFHAKQTIAALEAGKHVLLEKPMAMNTDECDAILEAEKRTGKLVQIGMVNRFRSSSQALKKVMEAGRCGDVYTAQAFCYRRRGIPGFGGWFTTKEMSGGGGLIDIGVHMLDLSLYLMNFPKPVAISGKTYNVWDDLNNYTYTSMWGKPTPNGKKDVDDYATALVRFEQGQTLNLNISWALNIGPVNPDMGVRIMGTKGGVALEGIDNPYFYGEDLGQLTDTKLAITSNNPMAEEQNRFVDSIEKGVPIVATAAQGRMVQSILQAIYQSSASGREVVL